MGRLSRGRTELQAGNRANPVQCARYAVGAGFQIGSRTERPPLPRLPLGQLAGLFRIRNLLEKDKIHVGNVLRQFWQSHGVTPAEDRIRQFEERIVVGPRGQMAAALLLADDPANNPPYRMEYLNKAYHLVGREREEVGDDGGRRYRRMLDSWTSLS